MRIGKIPLQAEGKTCSKIRRWKSKERLKKNEEHIFCLETKRVKNLEHLIEFQRLLASVKIVSRLIRYLKLMRMSRFTG